MILNTIFKKFLDKVMELPQVNIAYVFFPIATFNPINKKKKCEFQL